MLFQFVVLVGQYNRIVEEAAGIVDLSGVGQFALPDLAHGIADQGWGKFIGIEPFKGVGKAAIACFERAVFTDQHINRCDAVLTLKAF